MTRIVVTGASGLLGSSLTPLLLAKGHTVIGLGRTGAAADLTGDLTHYGQVAALLDQAQPEIIVNLAALTNVDQCESAPDRAYRMNVLIVENLCAWIARRRCGCHLVQISSDMVYDGAGPHPEGSVAVRNTYALSKIASELAASRVASTVLRTNFFGRSQCIGRASFTDWLHAALRDNTPITVFDDVMFSPLSMNTLNEMLNLVVVERPVGVFNLGAREGMSKADFAFAFASVLQLPTPAMRRGMSGGTGTLLAARPKDMRMNCSRFERILQVRLPTLQEEIYTTGAAYRA